MKEIFYILVGAILMAMIAPIVAELPSDAVDAVSKNRQTAEQPHNRSIINPMDPGYIWGVPFAINLSGVDPLIFENAAFRKDPGGLTSGYLYTTSINDFRNADRNAGDSNATKNVSRLGLVNLPYYEAFNS